MPPARFEPTISAGERTQTYALDLTATGAGNITFLSKIKYTINNALVIVTYEISYNIFYLTKKSNQPEDSL